MSAEKQKRSFWVRLKDSYRLIVMNKETFEEVGSYSLSLLNVYVLLSSIIVLVAILMWLAFAYTPLSRLLPGSNVIDKISLYELYRDIDSLEQLTIAQAKYNESFRRMLTGTVQYEPDKLQPPPHKNGYSTEDFSLSPAEEQIRSEAEELIDGEENIAGGVSVNTSPRGNLPLEQINFTPPLSGTVSATFSLDKKHLGVDIIAPKNTPIKAPLSGWVIFSDWTLETGNTVAIQHANNIVTFYKHNSSLLKKTGVFVRAGEAIAIIGNTGELTDGPHLHFEIWSEGKPLNPTDFMSFK